MDLDILRATIETSLPALPKLIHETLRDLDVSDRVSNASDDKFRASQMRITSAFDRMKCCIARPDSASIPNMNGCCIEDMHFTLELIFNFPYVLLILICISTNINTQ